MRFTLRQLQLFVAACETESVTLAAERENISQSAASSSIAQLEKAVGLQLLIRRHAHGVSPTSAGRRFLEGARAVLTESLALDRIPDELLERVAGRLSIGCLVTLAPIILPELLQSFSLPYPEVTFAVEEQGQAVLLEALRTGRISLALTYDLGLEPDIAFESLATLPPFAVFAENDPLAQRTSVPLKELAARPMVLLDLPISRDYFRGLFAVEGLEPIIVHRSVQPDVVRSMVANGFGYTLVNARPKAEVALDGRRVSEVPISGEHRPMQIGLASVATARQPLVVRAFREHCFDLISHGRVPGMKVV